METSQKIIVVGAGIIGASIAYHLARRGAEVVILDKTGPAAEATGKSFAWINANHAADDVYHRLRYQSLAEYHRLDGELKGALGLQWGGSLCFDTGRDDQEERLARFQALGYAVEAVSHNQFRDLEPNYEKPPEHALHLALEGCIQPIRATSALIDAATAFGARVIYGGRVKKLRRDGDRLLGLSTEWSDLAAKAVILAAGTGAADLLATIGVDLPMDDKPGVMLYSKPVEPVLDHVIWGDRIHIKQQDDGRLVVGEIFSADGPGWDPSKIAEEMLTEVRACLPGIDIDIERVTVGLRPIPKDGMPIVGHVRGVENLYVAVMHSGITLAPIMGRMTAGEILDDIRFEALSPYRPDRFF